MTSTGEKIRQLAPHWGVMFLLMLAVLAVVERLVGPVGFVPSMVLVFAVAFGYPIAARALGVAPPVWQRP
ncbi:hypothetical protein U4E84_13260 [Halorubrum sp. AD140]|uniref:hypothetical protein n=1 Tax=Halorubrum sp. AD140 TaxID=3050073 RepID=UPI002ACC8D0F|nr:hypothetical protein [Halorubrum sp. AD140]MDZ5812311.1 hypothetical protein [Halorubrum sp. AD140]